MSKADKVILSLVLFTLAYFGAHVAWALTKSWFAIAAGAMPK